MMENGKGLKKQTDQASFKGLKLSGRQKNFLLTLETLALNVGATCKKLRMSRNQYELWTRTNDDFKIAVSHIEEMQVDIGESALKRKIAEGDTKAIIYFLDNKARHRGYGQKIDLTNTHLYKPVELSHLSDEELLELENKMLEARVTARKK